MEGLLVAEALEGLKGRLPSERSSWRFPDAYTFVLPLGKVSLWLYLKPPNPRLSVEKEFPPTTTGHSGFQELLASRAAGPLLRAEQLKLDRVVSFDFGPSSGFVSRPAVRLVAELTGRNCNLVLVDEAGTVLGVMREVSSSVNRYRELRSGLSYVAPPPYDKLDPREAGDEALAQALAGGRLKDLHKHLDGLGPRLTLALASRLGLAPGARLDTQTLPRLLPVLRELAEKPSAFLSQDALAGIGTLREEESRQEVSGRLREELGKAQRKLERRLDDLERAKEAAAEVELLRGHGDLLMAHSYSLPDNVPSVTLQDFSGEEVTLALDPKLSAIDNAQAFYKKAKKRQGSLEQALARAPKLQEELEAVREQLASLPTLSQGELAALAGVLVPKEQKQARRELGIRYTSPQGYRLLVGRNARENDSLTMKVAKSQDVWLHVQGYHGSHVIVQTQGKEPPFETIIFAAELAAAYSQAADSDNVAVDYALKKNVWKPKGGAAGAVHYSQQKTLYVTPNKHREADPAL